jgi:hypothetical protein
MKKIFLGIIFVSGIALADNGLPASKAATQVSNVNLISSTGSSTGWATILSAQMKTAPKDLFIGVSLQTGLLTSTSVATAGANSTAKAAVKVRVMVDGRLADPGEVIYNSRSQELTASLGGALQACTGSTTVTTIPTTVPLTINCTSAPQTLQLLLNTLEANTFNFILTNLGTGIHTIQVQAAIDIGPNSGISSASALVGKGSLTIEEVRLAKGTDVLTAESEK